MMDKLRLAIAARDLNYHIQGGSGGPAPPSALGQAVITATVIIFALALFSISYTYGEVIPTLAIIEDPTATAFISLDTQDPDSKNGEVTNEEVLVLKNRPITSSFRKVLRHLRSTGGRLAPWRGLSIYLVNGMATGCTTNFLIKIFPWSITQSVAGILAILLCARLSLAWTHIVISEPSSKYWFRRIPAWKTWTKVAPATALQAFATQLVIILPAKLSGFALLPKMLDDVKGDFPTEEQKRAICAQLVQSTSIALVVGTLLSVLILIPASVTLTRVQASMLPETEETVVPFDRSFGGKVVPEITGGSGVIGLLDAWKTFTWESRIRLLKVFFKSFVIQAALVALFLIVIAVEMVYLVPDSVTVLKNLNAGRHPMAGF